MQIQRVAFLRAVHARVVARRYHSGYEISKRHRDARYQVGVSRLAGVVKSYALYLCRGLADAVVLKRYDLLIPLSPNAGGRTHGIVVAQLHLARIVRANLGHKSAAGVKLCLRLDGVYLAVNYHAFAVDGDSVDVDVRLGKAVAISARGMRAAVARVVARRHVESHSQFALGYFKGALALFKHSDEGIDVHRAAGDEVGLGRMVGLSVDADAGHLRHRLAYAVLLKVSGLLIPLGPYRAGRTHVVVVVQVGLGSPGRAFLRSQLAAGVKVYLRLHAVEINVGNSAVGSQGVGASRHIDLGQAVGLGRGVRAGVAVGAALLQIEGVALLGTVHTRVVAGGDNTVDEVGERHGDTSHQVGIGGHAAVVNGYARDLVRSLADAILLESPDLLIPLSADTACAAHRVVVVELHLAENLAGEVGCDCAAGVEVGLALDGVYLAVNNDALAVDGHGVDVHVGLGQAVGIRARI